MIQIKNEPQSEYKKSMGILKKNIEKGNRYLLWRRVGGIGEKARKYSCFSIIKDIEKTDKDTFMMHTIDYRLDGSVKEETPNEIEEIRADWIAFNTRNYDIYLLTEEEAKPYLKQALVISLNNQPIKVEV